MKQEFKDLTKDPGTAVALLLLGIFLFIWLSDGLLILGIVAAIVTAVGFGVYKVAKPAAQLFEDELGSDEL